jgi:hypothetical protein
LQFHHLLHWGTLTGDSASGFTEKAIEAFDNKYGDKIDNSVSKFTEKEIGKMFDRKDNHDYIDRNDSIRNEERNALDTLLLLIY